MSNNLLISLANKFEMEPKKFEDTIKKTVMPNNGDNVKEEEFNAFLLVAKEYNLNPITKEIYAFIGKTGGIQPIVGVDGWVRIINEHPKFDGMTFDDRLSPNGKIISITCNIFRKDRSNPTVVTEYLAECDMGTHHWKKYPVRMLRHKSLIQCARYAFGFSGIIDHDEYTRMMDVTPQATEETKKIFEELYQKPSNTVEVIEQKEDELLDSLSRLKIAILKCETKESYNKIVGHKASSELLRKCEDYPEIKESLEEVENIIAEKQIELGG